MIVFLYNLFYDIYSNDYSVSYFKQFNIVMNALDNRVARNHVNRMCLAAKVPLIETGTAGYAGQVSYFIYAGFFFHFLFLNHCCEKCMSLLT